MRSVSYTHLDVYKRQILGSFFIFRLCCIVCSMDFARSALTEYLRVFLEYLFIGVAFSAQGIFLSVWPVSYTHLLIDVNANVAKGKVVAVLGQNGSGKTDVYKRQILYIMCDQFRYDCIRALGNQEIFTPNIDRLVKRGLVSVSYTHLCRATQTGLPMNFTKNSLRF